MLSALRSAPCAQRPKPSAQCPAPSTQRAEPKAKRISAQGHKLSAQIPVPSAKPILVAPPRAQKHLHARQPFLPFKPAQLTQPSESQPMVPTANYFLLIETAPVWSTMPLAPQMMSHADLPVRNRRGPKQLGTALATAPAPPNRIRANHRTQPHSGEPSPHPSSRQKPKAQRPAASAQRPAPSAQRPAPKT